MKMKQLLFVAFMIFLADWSFSQPGTLDSTFGNNGTVSTQIGQWASILDIALQPDQKIVAVGITFNGSNNDFAMARYIKNGILDQAFGIGGVVITPIGNSNDVANSIKIQADGKILVSGYSNSGMKNDFALVRYNSNGTLDNTFGTNGVVLTSFSSFPETANSLLIQSDGKILVSGYSENNGIAMARFDQNGNLDPAFGIEGKVLTIYGNYSAEGLASINSSGIQSDGKIVLSGSIHDTLGEDFFLIRYHTNGSIDSSFGEYGRVRTGYFPNFQDRIFDMKILSDNKIACTGSSTQGLQSSLIAIRYNSDGTLDTTFNTPGGYTPFHQDPIGGTSLSIQSNGKVVIAGYNAEWGPSLLVSRHLSNGELDTTFGDQGIVICDTLLPSSSLAIQVDGRIICSIQDIPFKMVCLHGDPVENTEEFNFTNQIQVFPNPANDKIKIEIPTGFTKGIISLYSLPGQLIHKQNIDDHENIVNISKLAKGVYLLRINYQDHIKVAKFLKE